MTVEELVQDIAKYVAAHSQRQYRKYIPFPETTINSYELLDHLSEVTGIEKETIGKWYDQASLL